MIRTFAFAISFSSTVVCFGQIHDTAWSKTISLPDSDFIKAKKRLALFASDSFIIYSSFDIVVDNIQKFIRKYDVEEDKWLLKKFFNTSKSLEKNLADIQKDDVLKARLNYRTADLIQTRKCLIYNVTSKKFESQVIITNYIKNWWNGIKFSTQVNQTIMDLETGAF
jgi:hypothetical protein